MLELGWGDRSERGTMEEAIEKMRGFRVMSQLGKMRGFRVMDLLLKVSCRMINACLPTRYV